MKQARPYPKLIVTRKAARSLAAGHPWLWAGEVVREEAGAEGRAAANGDVVDLFEENGTWQGAALLSAESTIRARLVSRNANDRIDDAFWRRRIAWAWAHRVRTMGADRSCCRVLFSEADGLPGLVVDRYGDVLVAQVGTCGMELRRHGLYVAMLDALAEAGEDVRHVYERCDSPARTREGLELRAGWWRGEDGSRDVPSSARIEAVENGVRYAVDLEHGQKTGFFLDQKYNRAAVARLSAGLRVMDCFCHVGPFGLNALAGGADYVRFVDASEGALEAVRANASLNGVDGARFGTSREDIVRWLPELARDKARLRELGGPFDLIVLDPPAFAKRASDVRAAAGAYRSINEAALRLLPRGGYLATCSCSQHMTRDLLAKAIGEAAHGAGVQLRQVEERQQAPDHPVLWGFPESHYLDFFIFQSV